MSNKSHNNVEINAIIMYDGQMITAEQIKFGFIASGLTAKAVSEMTDVSQNAISNMLKNPPPHTPNKRTVSAVLDAIDGEMKKNGWRFMDGGIVRESTPCTAIEGDK